MVGESKIKVYNVQKLKVLFYKILTPFLEFYKNYQYKTNNINIWYTKIEAPKLEYRISSVYNIDIFLFYMFGLNHFSTLDFPSYFTPILVSLQVASQFLDLYMYFILHFIYLINLESDLCQHSYNCPCHSLLHALYIIYNTIFCFNAKINIKYKI